MTNNQQQAVELEAMRGNLPQTAEAWAFALGEACNAAAKAGAKADSDTFLEAVRAIQRQASRATKGQDGLLSALEGGIRVIESLLNGAPEISRLEGFDSLDSLKDALQQTKGQGGCHE